MAEVKPVTHLQRLIHRTGRGLTLPGLDRARGVTVLRDGRGSFTLIVQLQAR